MKRKLSVKVLVLALILAIAMPTGAFASVTELTMDSTAPGMSLAGSVYTNGGKGYDDIEFQWSKTEDATHVVVFEGVTTTEGLVLSLDKDADRPYVDPELYPYNAETSIGDLSKFVDKEGNPCFEVVETEVVDGDLHVTLLTHGTEFYYTADQEARADGIAKNYSIDHTNGGKWLDNCGYYDLNLTVGGKVVGSVPAKVVPYDSYRTTWELVDAVAALGEAETDRYVETGSIGHTSIDSYDVPYVVVADNEEDVTTWLEYVDAVKEDPTAVLADLKAGKYDDLAVPVYVSNCHANENPAVNGPMNFAEYLVYGDNVTFTTAVAEDTDYPFSTNEGKVVLNTLEDYTEAGKAKLEQEKTEVFGTGISSYIAKWVDELGRLRGEYGDTASSYGISAPVDFEKYYKMGTDEFTVEELLDDVFYVIVPTMNLEGYTQSTRATGVGFDPNRDYANQVQNENRNAMHFMSSWIPMVYAELHGRVTGYSVEPCGAPHNPNIEYDLIGKQFFQMGASVGKAMVANNERYNSFELCGRDYIEIDPYSTNPDNKVQWGSPWDDLSTNFGSQFPVFFGTSGITWEQPAYDDITSEYSIPAGLYGLGRYVQENKAMLLGTQAELFERGVTNYNSNEEVAPYYVDQYDNMGVQADIMRPVYDGEGENGNFYPEAYIIPLDKENQRNIQDAAETVIWVVRNNAEYMIAEEAFEYDGVEYPAGTVVVSMYQPFRSIVNCQLSDGQFVKVWKGLYSEAFSQSRIARGFDQITVTEPAAYEAIEAACVPGYDYEGTLEAFADFAAQFSGVEGADVIISNASEDAALAVNALLAEGATVGMITEGDYMGDFICKYDDFVAVVADEYTVAAEGVYGADVVAQVIAKSPVVFINGGYGATTAGNVELPGGNQYCFDQYALKQMGFDLTKQALKADAIVGNGFGSSNPEDALAIEAVKAGTPYMVWGSGAGLTNSYRDANRVTHYTNIFENINMVTEDDTVRYMGSMSTGTDMTAVVKYPETTLINANYVLDGDDLNYQYGTAYFAEIPEGAVALVQNAGEEPLTGCVLLEDGADAEYTAALHEEFDAYNNAVVAFEYQGEGMDVVAFANSLTHKGHPQDEFKYIANFLFSRSLADEAYAGVEAPEVTPDAPADKPEADKPADAPATGDATNAMAWVVVAMAAAVALGAVVYKKEK